jgi:phage-related protein
VVDLNIAGGHIAVVVERQRLCHIGHTVSRRPDKPLAWLRGEVKTPPFSTDARVEAGFLLRRLQQGESLSLPHSRPMSGIGPACHELRVTDRDQTWRIVYHVAADAVVVLDVFSKKTETTPAAVLEACRRRLAAYQAATKRGSEHEASKTRSPRTRGVGRR